MQDCQYCKSPMIELKAKLKNGTKAYACAKCDSGDAGTKTIIQLSEENIT